MGRHKTPAHHPEQTPVTRQAGAVMQMVRPVGREAAAKKYDILSALMAHALAGDAQRQRLILRLMALITSRYNWQRNELTVGQREIARLWCVDERTVKRDMARLRAMGWVTVKRQGARGRVSVLGLDLERMLLDSRPDWSHIGDDYVARMTGRDLDPMVSGHGAPGQGGPGQMGAGQGADAAPEGPNVVPFRRTDAGDAAPGGIWSLIRDRLKAEDPALFDAWFAALAETDAGARTNGLLHLTAPSRFHATYVRTHLLGRLQVAVRRADAGLQGVRID